MKTVDIDEMLKIEELGRLIASSAPTVTRVMDFYGRLYRATVDMTTAFSTSGDYLGGSTASALSDHAFYALLFFKKARKKLFTPSAVELWNMENPTLGEIKKKALSTLKTANNYCSEMTGKRCAWLSDRWEVSVNATINDATAIFHRLIERVRPEVEFNCPRASLADPNADEFFKKTACYFSMAEILLRKNGATAPTDYRETHATIYRNRVDFRVGSSPGHMTTLTKSELRYYDDDMPVNRTLRYLLMRAGVMAKVIKGELPGLKGKVLREKPELLGATIAMATSMDFRVNAYANILYALWSHEYDLTVMDAVKTFWFVPPSSLLVTTVAMSIKRLGIKYPPSPKYMAKIEADILNAVVLDELRRK